MNKFIKENRKLWSQFKIKNSGKKILIEEPGQNDNLFHLKRIKVK